MAGANTECETFFEIAVKEAYKDGVVSQEEAGILDSLQRELQVAPEVRSRLEGFYLAEFEAGRIGRGRLLMPMRVYQKCLKRTLEQRDVDPDRKQHLQAVARVLGISADNHKAALEWLRENREPAPVARSAPPVPADATIRRLAEETASILKQAETVPTATLDLHRACDIVREAADAFLSSAQNQGPAIVPIVNLATLLAKSQKLDLLEECLRKVLDARSTYPTLAAVYTLALQNAAVPQTSLPVRQPFFEVVEMASRLAHSHPESPEAWAGFAKIGQGLGRQLATYAQWPELERLWKLLGKIPKAAEGTVAPVLALAAADRVVFALDKNNFREAFQARAYLESLRGRQPQDEVVRQLAIVYECFIDKNIIERRFLEPPQALEILREATKLMLRQPTDREIARAFSNMSGSAELLLLAAGNEDELLALLENLASLVVRFPRDEQIAFNIARGIVNATIARSEATGKPGKLRRLAAALTGRPGQTDRIVQQLENTLATAVRACPGSPKLVDARQRFRNTTGR